MDLNAKPSGEAWERTLDRSGSTCTTTHGRPAQYIQASVTLLWDSYITSPVSARNSSGSYIAQVKIYMNVNTLGTHCAETHAKGAQIDDGTWIKPDDYVSVAECATYT